MVRGVLLVGLLCASVSMSACSSAGTGVPTDSPAKSGQPASPPGSKPGLPYGGAPKVAHPVDTAKYHADPCTAVSPKEVKNLGLQEKPTSDPTGSPGPSCTYPGGATGISVNWAFIKGNDGLSTIYSKKNNFNRFQPQKDANGFPTLIALSKPDPGPSACTYWVGVSDDELVYVSVTEPDYKKNHVNVCNDTRQVALGLTATITGG